MDSARDHRADEGARGQASVELIAILPALVLAAVLAAHGAAAGWALWSAADAARAGARAEHVGGDAGAVARRDLPALLRDGAKIEVEESVRVSVRAPMLLPGVEGPRIGAATALDPADD